MTKIFISIITDKIVLADVSTKKKESEEQDDTEPITSVTNALKYANDL